MWLIPAREASADSTQEWFGQQQKGKAGAAPFENGS
jgi:hypothetical protein